jgi:hypothetical protein
VGAGMSYLLAGYYIYKEEYELAVILAAFGMFELIVIASVIVGVTT